LTFDDGPDAEATEPLLALLGREGIHAAFFCVGTRVLEHPELASRIVEEGHLLENHSHHHSSRTYFLSTAALFEEVSRAQDAIRTATGLNPRYYRPPVGLMSPAVPRVMRRLGLHCVGWDVRSLDRAPISAARVVRRIRRGLREGSIILLHDGGVDSLRLLSIVEQVIVFARREGYRFVRLEELLGHGSEASRSAIA
jgi:peptidoglycan/xylan/chitin deacetylase (PgdA/CDA1 family)